MAEESQRALEGDDQRGETNDIDDIENTVSVEAEMRTTDVSTAMHKRPKPGKSRP